MFVNYFKTFKNDLKTFVCYFSVLKQFSGVLNSCENALMCFKCRSTGNKVKCSVSKEISRIR